MCLSDGFLFILFIVCIFLVNPAHILCIFLLILLLNLALATSHRTSQTLRHSHRRKHRCIG